MAHKSKIKDNLPNARYFNLIDSAIEAYLKGTLVPRESDRCFIGSYVFYKTSIRNTGWYLIYKNNVDGENLFFDEEITEEDRLCYEAIDYSDQEKTILMDKFDNAKDIWTGLLLAADAAYKMENWEFEFNVNLVEMIKEHAFCCMCGRDAKFDMFCSISCQREFYGC